ncbi:MAG TPA: ATP-binding protein [Dehalococcoidia bacterium]|nr:ATP-binding protein [Dehalococcoidia bacterium]
MGRDRLSITSVVKRTHLFDGLSGPQLAKVVELCREQTYAAGQAIFAEGSVPKDFYIVKKGKVALDANFSARPGTWKQGTVDIVTDCEPLGWSAIAGSGKMTLSARAVEDTQLLAIDGASFRALLEQDTQMGYAVMHRVIVLASSRLRGTKETLARILSIASHDLRAPLNAVQSYLSVLAGGFFGEVPGRQREVLIRCNERLAEFSELIDNILDITRFEEGRLPLEPLSLGDIARDSVELLRPLAARRNIVLDLALPPGQIMARGSAGRLKQVMSNLVGNALKFTEPGGDVRVSLKAEGGQARVEVCDTGIGISPGDLPRIFDEFYRGTPPEGPDVETKGVGLGLSICRKIIEAHGGRIWAESPCPDTGKGSLFVFTLPQTVAGGDEGRSGSHAAGKTASGRRAGARHQGPGPAEGQG